jgi:hypothetical protein
MEAVGDEVDPHYRDAMFNRRGIGERIDEVGQRVLARLVPHAWPAVHMVWGAIQEITTYTAYRELSRRTGHPVLQELCRRIMKQEARHFAFYFHHARRRLAASARTRMIARAALAVGWTPVGEGMQPREESVHAVRYLFDGHEGTAIGEIERRVRELPGLEQFDMFTRFAQRHDIRRAPASWYPPTVTEAAQAAQ